MLGNLFLLPLLTAYMACSHGRRFWVWLLIGCGLPYVSLFVVMLVVRRDRQKARLLPLAPTSPGALAA
ncbi:hypothetical protein [Hymenobacter algoricola]|uniref:DUF805 domain-containing protein n=1 Tax=Hymenobacter algoricola TaxID=486267 RepID=A0ABP7MMX1_9BACT